MRPRRNGASGKGAAGPLLFLLTASALAACTAPKEEPRAAAVGVSRRALATLSPGFQETTVWPGFNRPTAVRFAPDGRVFVAEKRGRVLVFDSVADTTVTEFARLDTNVHDYWDRGLLGLAVHPQFPTQPYIYVLYTLDAPIGGTPPVWNDECPTPPGGTADGCVVGARLSRLTASGDASTGETVLLEAWGQQYPSHSIGNLGFGADGALYVSSGDGASFGFVDYGQRGMPRNPLGDPPVAVGGVQTPPTAAGGALRSQSLRRTSGPTLLNGAILRLDPMTGAALPDNPLFASADENARRVVAYGLRNPFRFTTRPGTSEIWVGDVGFNTWEEINRVVNPTDAVVENFGWPCYEGRGRLGGYDGANLDICEKLYLEPAGATAPHFTYNHAAKVVSNDLCQFVGSSSTTALAFYTGDKYPPKYKGALFFGDHSRDCAWVMLPGADGVPDPTKIEPFGDGMTRPVDLQMGPDGYLYYVDVGTVGADQVGTGEIRRITYLLPKAVATGAPLTGTPPLVVSFDGSGSTPPLPGDTLTYAWDLDGDGQFDDASEARPTAIFDKEGTTAVRLQVSDQRGVAVASDPLSVVVSATAMPSTPPVPVIDTPLGGLRWKVGDVITFSGHATDAEDGALPASALSWMLVMQHCPSGCHAHVVQTWNGSAGASFSAPDHEFPSHIELVLTAVDSSGIRRSSTRRLDPATVFVTLASQPPGMQVALGVEELPAPFGREFILGGLTSATAPALQTVNNVPYSFVSWSDGLAPSHDLGPLHAHQTLLASYRPAGLTAEYFEDIELKLPKLTRIDPEVNFDWERGSPDPSLPDSFSARWTGFVLPPVTDLYTFATDSDDGIRVWVNNVLVIDAWTRHSVQRNRGFVPLLGGVKTRIRVEFFDDLVDAVAKLYWSSLSSPTVQVIPAARLYPGCVAGACPSGLTCQGEECVAPCPASCPAGQRCLPGSATCVDACKDLSCGRGKCVAGSCLPRCEGVTCAAGLTCTPETGLCEDQACKTVTCVMGKTCQAGLCRPICEVTPCGETSKCNLASGACEPKCKDVNCEPGFECAPASGTCQDRCLTLTCPGQACQLGECKPTCVVKGCGASENCNATSGACEAKCAMITCAPGAACVPTTGQCESCSGAACGDAGVPPGGDGGQPGTDGEVVDGGVEDAPEADVTPGAGSDAGAAGEDAPSGGAEAGSANDAPSPDAPPPCAPAAATAAAAT